MKNGFVKKVQVFVNSCQIITNKSKIESRLDLDLLRFQNILPSVSPITFWAVSLELNCKSCFNVIMKRL